MAKRLLPAVAEVAGALAVLTQGLPPCGRMSGRLGAGSWVFALL